VSAQQNQSRDDWVDLAKGIGIVLVVYGHVARGLETAGLYPDQQVFELIDSVIYSFHMPLFFVLSGLYFLPTLKHYGSGSLIGRKVDTLIYPYIIWSVIQGSIEVALSHFTNSHTGIGEVLSILWQPHDQFWFLYALFFIFLLFAIMFKLAQQAAVSWLLFLVLLVAFVANVHFGVPAADYVVNYGVFFACGVLLSKYPTALRRVPAGLRAIGFTFFAICLAQTACHVFALPLGALGRMLSFLLALFSIGCVLVLSRSLKPGLFRWLDVLGRNSMPIYLMHIIFASGTRVMLSKVLHVQDLWIQLGAGVLMGLIAPLVANAMFRRFKMGFLLLPPGRLQMARQRTSAV
jgi:fucose 4-O-acetylase-like acetyltransferase